MKPHVIILSIVVLGCIFVSACSSSPPIPSDKELTDKLIAEEQFFQSLVADHTDQKLLKKLGVIHVQVLSKKPPALIFIVWMKDLFGPGGWVKGFYYSEIQPALLVESTDEIYATKSADQVEAFHHVQGPWYIYYSASN